MLGTLFTLNNPRLAPILVIIATAVISFALALGVMLMTRKRFMARSIDEHSKGELRYLHAQLTQYEADIQQLNDRITALKQKIAVIALCLGRAVTEVKLDD